MNCLKTILVAPLNWGLGHATRCIPIINALKSEGFKVILASDGGALELLKKEFPDTLALSLPSYDIQYSKNGRLLKQKLLSQTPRISKAIKAEHRILQGLIHTYTINGVISDNRLGLHTTKVPTVFITHQLTVLSGNTTWFSSYIHNCFIKKFDTCWVPDSQGDKNLSGRMGHPRKMIIPTIYIGALSRMVYKEEHIKYKAIAILSGPEPQRTQLEDILVKELSQYAGKVLLVQGIIDKEQRYYIKDRINIVNYLTSSQLEREINRSEFVIARSGYTTIMDLACLGKKAFFIPTSGQTEQEYLAQRLQDKGYAPFSNQDDFTWKHLDEISSYEGLKNVHTNKDISELFGLFKGE